MILWMLLVVGASVLLIVVDPQGQQANDGSQGWISIARDLSVPMSVAAFSWWLHLIARSRQEEFEERESKRREDLEFGLQNKRQQHEASLQASQAALELKLQEREEALERDLEREYRRFRRQLEGARQGWQVKLAQQRDRMAARLSIASHVGDVNGHLSAIEGILSAMPQEDPSEIAASQDEPDAVEIVHESAFEITHGLIRIPERLLPLIHMPESQRR